MITIDVLDTDGQQRRIGLRWCIFPLTLVINNDWSLEVNRLGWAVLILVGMQKFSLKKLAQLAASGSSVSTSFGISLQLLIKACGQKFRCIWQAFAVGAQHGSWQVNRSLKGSQRT